MESGSEVNIINYLCHFMLVNFFLQVLQFAETWILSLFLTLKIWKTLPKLKAHFRHKCKFESYSELFLLSPWIIQFKLVLTCSKCYFPLFNKKYAFKYPTLIWRIYFQDSASEGEGAGDEIPDIEEKEDGGSGNEFEEDDFIVDAEG